MIKDKQQPELLAELQSGRRKLPKELKPTLTHRPLTFMEWPAVGKQAAEAIQSLRDVLEEWLNAVGPEQVKRARIKARTLLGDS